jgi:dipeptidase E
MALRRLLLISSSTLHGGGFLDHAAVEIQAFLGAIPSVLFFPYALQDRGACARQARDRFRAMGYALESADEAADPSAAAAHAPAFFVGGGNTFRLVDALHRLRLLDPIRARVASGVPYVGSSAGAIVAGPTIGTTKDMPIVEPPSFEALALAAFQISPHYLDPDPGSTHMGETQEQRILQFHEEHAAPVAGLREGAMLRVERESIVLKGIAGARIFRRGRPPVETLPIRPVEELLEPGGPPV